MIFILDLEFRCYAGGNKSKQGGDAMSVWVREFNFRLPQWARTLLWLAFWLQVFFPTRFA
jgi:hypothetical protein